jgi:hypothetical protein
LCFAKAARERVARRSALRRVVLWKVPMRVL